MEIKKIELSLLKIKTMQLTEKHLKHYPCSIPCKWIDENNNVIDDYCYPQDAIIILIESNNIADYKELVKLQFKLKLKPITEKSISSLFGINLQHTGINIIQDNTGYLYIDTFNRGKPSKRQGLTANQYLELFEKFYDVFNLIPQKLAVELKNE